MRGVPLIAVMFYRRGDENEEVFFCRSVGSSRRCDQLVPDSGDGVRRAAGVGDAGEYSDRNRAAGRIRNGRCAV